MNDTQRKKKNTSKKKKLSVKEYEWKKTKGAKRKSRRKAEHSPRRENGQEKDDSWKNLSDREALQLFAVEALQSRQLLFEFLPAEKEELKGILQRSEKNPVQKIDESYVDLRHLPWVSIDNDDTRDIDQLTAAEIQTDGTVRAWVSVADVAYYIPKGTLLDLHAYQNTVSVYTPAVVFTMLPEEMSYDLTSLVEGQDRLAHVMEMVFESPKSGNIINSKVHLGIVRNKVKLAYKSLSKWLLGKGDPPPALSSATDSAVLMETIKVQDSIAQAVLEARRARGTLEFESSQPITIFSNDTVIDLVSEPQNRAQQLIENFMISANETTSKFLNSHGFPSIQRVVRNPEKWSEIVKFAAAFNHRLPENPDSRALRAFLTERRQADPMIFQDVSLTVIKLLGRGEYVFTKAGVDSIGHFALSVHDYTHSTAPNRRYPDLITQRLVVCALKGENPPYLDKELNEIAQKCTNTQDIVAKVERQLTKSAAAFLLADHVGELFLGIITGSSTKGTYVRLIDLPVEGKLNRVNRLMRVGEKVSVHLEKVDIKNGWIDFVMEDDGQT